MINNTENNPRPEWLFGGNPKSIEDQEAEGQQQLVNSSQLPLKINSPNGLTALSAYDKMGISVIGGSEGDDIFVNCKLPSGWKLQATDHSMWSNLVDERGRKRASIFYKAAFYDRSAFVNILPRYSESFHLDRKLRDSGEEKYCFNVVVDADGTELFRSDAYKYAEDNDQASRWLNDNFPNHNNIEAYW